MSETRSTITTLEGCSDYSLQRVQQPHREELARSSRQTGFKGTWTWSKSSGVITFQETNGSGCTWTAVKTSTGLDSESSPGVAECGGTDYAWYALKK